RAMSGSKCNYRLAAKMRFAVFTNPARFFGCMRPFAPTARIAESAMDWNATTAAVIPCHNEAARIGRFVAGVRQFLDRVIVVDDRSTDGTGANARRSGAAVVRLPKNSGKGAALRRGWQAARDQGFSRVLMLDGDGQHAPEDLPRLIDCARRTGAALVI